MTAHVCPWTGDCQCDRDSAACTCGHDNVSHGYGWSLEKLAGTSRIGAGSCGHCDCTAFASRPAGWWAETALEPLFEMAGSRREVIASGPDPHDQA